MNKGEEKRGGGRRPDEEGQGNEVWCVGDSLLGWERKLRARISALLGRTAGVWLGWRVAGAPFGGALLCRWACR